MQPINPIRYRNNATGSNLTFDASIINPESSNSIDPATGNIDYYVENSYANNQYNGHDNEPITQSQVIDRIPEVMEKNRALSDEVSQKIYEGFSEAINSEVNEIGPVR